MDSENLPIDIHSSKLLDWLISRRHCGKNWQPQVVSVRAKINNAIQDMPENENIVKLLQGTYINYFHCLEIIDILKKTEVDSKNFFGQYSSQRMKDWLDVVKCYEKDSVYLAEAAQLLQRTVQYEIPAIKKQMAKCQQNQDECIKKEQEAIKQCKESERNFEQECQKMGVKGVKIRSELLTLAQQLPNFFDSVAEKMKSLKPAVEYYRNYLEYTNMGPLDDGIHLLDTLGCVLQNGNVTYFQLTTGNVPTLVERPSFLIDEQIEEEGEAEVGGRIDFGLDGVDEGGDIDFGEFETVDSGAADGENGKQETHDTVARGLDALSVLEHTESQKLVDRKSVV